MRVAIRDPGRLLPSSTQEYAVSRLARALARFAGRIERITLTVSDVNGHRGGVDKRCRLAARMRPLGAVAIQSTGSDWRQAIDAAVERLRSAIVRAIERRRERRVAPQRRTLLQEKSGSGKKGAPPRG